MSSVCFLRCSKINSKSTFFGDKCRTVASIQCEVTFKTELFVWMILQKILPLLIRMIETSTAIQSNRGLQNRLLCFLSFVISYFLLVFLYDSFEELFPQWLTWTEKVFINVIFLVRFWFIVLPWMVPRLKSQEFTIRVYLRAFGVHSVHNQIKSLLTITFYSYFEIQCN